MLHPERRWCSCRTDPTLIQDLNANCASSFQHLLALQKCINTAVVWLCSCINMKEGGQRITAKVTPNSNKLSQIGYCCAAAGAASGARNGRSFWGSSRWSQRWSSIALTVSINTRYI